MAYANKLVNMVLSGGGIKGIAFIGAFEVAEKRGYKWGNIAGVSAGALAGAYAGAGYKAQQIKQIMNEFDFKKMQMGVIQKKVPAVARLIEYRNERGSNIVKNVFDFLNSAPPEYRDSNEEAFIKAPGYRGSMLSNILTFSKEGSLFDGDQLEEWVARTLAKRGIRTFGDLRGGTPDLLNPRGYKVRMTAVDMGRARIITLPDDIAYYGINPDRLEVAKAVRMSTSVPFAFKPVELTISYGSFNEKHYIVDGGVLDNFPFWTLDHYSSVPAVGFRLDGGEPEPNIVSIDSPLVILKKLISAVHDIGKPKVVYFPGNVALIDTQKVSFLDFNLGEEEKEYLYKAGIDPAERLFERFERVHLYRSGINYRRAFINPLLRRRLF